MCGAWCVQPSACSAESCQSGRSNVVLPVNITIGDDEEKGKEEEEEEVVVGWGEEEEGVPAVPLVGASRKHAAFDPPPSPGRR